MDTRITKEGKSIFITLGIKPNAPKTEIYRDFGGELMMKVKSPPTKGKANKEIEKFIKDKIGYQARIVKGKKSRTKMIEIPNIELSIEDLEKELIKL